MDIDPSIFETARQLYQQYGADAEVVATMRAAEFAAQMDIEALNHWDGVIAMLQHFTSGEGNAPDELIN